MSASDVTIVFNMTPIWIGVGLAAAFLALSVAIRVKERLEDAAEDKQERERASHDTDLDAAPRREALELIVKLGAVRMRMLELDRALTQRKSGDRWQFGIGADAGFRAAAENSDVDQFLSERTRLDLNAAQGDMISLFRGAAKWLEKYAPEDVPPPPFRKRIASAVRTFLSGIFFKLQRDDGSKIIPVVEKTEKNEGRTAGEPSEKVASAEPKFFALPEHQKSSEKLRISLDLLQAGKSGNPTDGAALRQNAKRISDTLRAYKIDAVPSGTPTRGPSVTRYEFRLQPGVKFSKLKNRSDDIALSMGVNSVNIAPVFGKNSVIGVEVPNAKASSVLLRDVLESRDFMYGSPTAFALGKGLDGKIVTADLDALPHVLIAGTTGSGKSVFLNAVIVSLLYKFAPEDLRLLLIDPKRVELTPYDGIPHLSQPVVTNPAQAIAALEQAAIGMDTRYKTFSDCGVNEISAYNRESKKRLPRIVIVIDELSDLMMTAGKELEESIIRIAQMGRAAGIHLVIATQRPSANVITGLMKANIPSRIAFKVASALESRIILDAAGAEKLIGNGDMLFYPVSGQPQRLQGAYITPEEISKVVRKVKELA